MTRLVLYEKGFTLVETLLVVTITVMLIGGSVGMYGYYQSNQILQSEKDEIIADIRYAAELSRLSKNNANHGVYMNQNVYTIYQGSSYQTRSVSEDIVRELQDGYSFAQIIDLNFAKESGIPSAAASIVIEQENSERTITIVVNGVGLVY